MTYPLARIRTDKQWDDNYANSSTLLKYGRL